MNGENARIESHRLRANENFLDMNRYKYIAPWTRALLASPFTGTEIDNISKQSRNLKQQ
jgi:hypothetical protein